MGSVSSPNPRSSTKIKPCWFYRLWKFSRPHTIIGTSLSVLALFLIALAIAQPPLTWGLFGQWLGAWFACLCGNVYIVGLNQLEDVAIDRINKPHLPIAAGELSQRQGQWIVGITGILALGVSGLLGPWLLLTVGTSLILGTAYSLPPIRLKRFPLLAALCILSVRGAIVNLGLFLHFNQRFDGVNLIPSAVWALTGFVLVFSVAIALFKDVPDQEGDRRYHITTFTILLGKPLVFGITLSIIASCYVALIVAGFFRLPGVNLNLLILSHGALLGLFTWRAQNVNLQCQSSIASFYQFIWKLFFLEYLLFPLVCWWPN